MATDRHRDHKTLNGANCGAAVILDSNFLFIPLRFGVDIFGELRRLFGRPVRCIVTTPIISELQLLRLDAKPSFKKEIDFALGLADRCEVKEESRRLEERVDDLILRVALETGYSVATNDVDLRRRLRAEGVPVVYLRQRNHLEIDGFI